MEQKTAAAQHTGTSDLKNALQLEMKGRGLDALVDHVVAQNALLTDMSQRLRHLHKRQTILQETIDLLSGLEGMPADGFLETVDIGAMMPLRQEYGFFSLEYDKRGVPFRWTGPKQDFRFNLYLKRDVERTLTLKLRNFSLSEDSEIRGWLNGNAIEWSCVTRHEEYTSFELRTPILKQANTVSSLIFEVPKTFRPQEINPKSKDTRTLGVAFHSLTGS